MVESSHDVNSRQDLSTELRQATQQDHTALNAAIITRLPLCLPPRADSAFSYAAGMVVFGQIYTAMERAWDSVLEQTGNERYIPLDDRRRNMLLTLKTQCLHRTERLHSDITNLKRSLGPHAAHTLDRLHESSRCYQDTIQAAIGLRPHVMLAYSWTMYLALFNGGRFIVKQLLRPGSQFWFGEQDANQITDKYLSFWYFDDTPKDNEHGTHVKNDFKSRFSIASESLTEEESTQVIGECDAIFAQCASMVTFLDLEMERLQDVQPQACLDDPQAEPDIFIKSSYISSILPLAGIWQNLRSALNYATNATVDVVKV